MSAIADGNGGNYSGYNERYGYNGAPGGGGGVNGLGGVGTVDIPSAGNGTAVGAGGSGSQGRVSDGTGNSGAPGAGGGPGSALSPFGNAGGAAGNASCSNLVNCPSYGASGGGGGGDGFVGSSLAGVGTAIFGGNGGNGGSPTNSSSSGADGGGGGGGGAGVVLSNGTALNRGIIVGGPGGNGGNSLANGGAGFGGQGGSAIVITNVTLDLGLYSITTGGDGGNGGNGDQANNGRIGASGGNGITGLNSIINNSAAVSGGKGGATGANGIGVSAGGIGIEGANLQIINSGTINGGMNGDGSQANAIYFTGGNNRLELEKGSLINGNVVAAFGNNIFALDALDASLQGQFNVGLIDLQYRGFSTFQKTGSGSWQLTNTTSQSTPWTIYDGTLIISADAALGSAANALTFGAAGVTVGSNISQGTGQLEVLSSFGMSRNIVLNGNGSINDAGQTLTSSGVISGAGNLNVEGAGGTLMLTGTASRSAGSLALSSGTLGFGPGARYNVAGAYTQAAGSTLNINLGSYTGPVISANNASLSGTLVVSNYTLSAPPVSASQLASEDHILIATTGGISGNLTTTLQDQPVSGYDYLRYGEISRGNNLVLGYSLAWNSLTTPTGNFTLNSGNFTVDEVLADRADDGNNLNMAGTGTLTLSAKNTYSGNTSINAGTLALSGNGSIGSSNALILNGGTVDVSGVNGGSTQVNNLRGVAGTTMLLGNTTLTVNDSLDTSFGGSIQGAGGVIKTGDGTLTLSGSNTFSGAMEVSSGTLSAGTTNSIAFSQSLTLDVGASFLLNGYNQSVARIASSGTGTIDLAAATLTLTGNGSPTTVSYEGTISGSGNLVKDGDFTQFLNGENALSYTGTTTINAGVLALRETINPSLNKQILLNGGWLDLSNSPVSTDWSSLVITDIGPAGEGGVIGANDVIHLQPGTYNVTIGAGGSFPDDTDGVFVVKDTPGETILGGTANTYVGNTRIEDGILTVSRDDLLGNTSISREVILSGGTLRVDGSFSSARVLVLAADGTMDVTAGNSTKWEGGITGTDGTAGFGFTKTGAGTLILSGVNDYIGATTLGQGTLVLQAEANLHRGNLVFASGAQDATLDLSGLNGATATIGTLTDKGVHSIIALGNTALTIQGGGVFNGVIQDAALSGATGGALLQSSNNSLTLSGVNTYTGPTTVAAGVLALSGSGSIDSSSSVSLEAPGAMLDISTTTAGASINNFSGVAGSAVALGKQTLIINETENLAFGGNISGSGGLEKNGGSTLTLSGNLAYTGNTELAAGTLILDGAEGGAQLVSNVIGQAGSTLSLVHGARLTGSIDPVDVTIDTSSAWNMTASSVLSNMTLAGTINFVAPTSTLSAGRTLTASNWVGQGGTVNLYAVVGNSASVTDQIIIDGGTASGTTKLHIVNSGGAGAQTTGDGIKVVDTENNATTAATAFTLAGGILYAGVYQYTLQRGGSESAQDWFLVSSVRPETSLYGALGVQGLRYGEVVAGSLQQRMGALDQLARKNDTYAWERLFGQTDDQAGTSGAIAQQTDIYGVQAGSDVYVQARGAGRDSAGLYFASGQSTANVDGSANARTGRNTLQGYSLGAYFTRLDGSGGYLDTVLQASWSIIWLCPPMEQAYWDRLKSARP